MKKLEGIWGNLSIRKKLLLSMIGLVFCSVSILGAYFYYISSNIIRTNLRRNIQSTMQQIGENLNYKVDVINTVLFDISVNPQIQNELTYLNTGELETYERAGSGSRLKNQLIFQCTGTDAITAVFLHDLRGNTYSTLQQYYPVPEYTEEEIYEKKGANLWMTKDEELDVIPIGKAVYSLNNQRPLGYLIMYVRTEYFDSVFENVSFSEEDYLFASDKNGRVILGKAPDGQGEYPVEPTDGVIKTLSFEDGLHQLYSVSLEENDWTAYSISLDESANYELLRLKRLSVIIILVVLLLVITLVIIISRGISRPIRKLAQSMNAFAQGDYGTQVDVKYQDEIGNLRNSFNYMAERTNYLINEVYEERNLKQQAQIHALQMQINPHFLYNTLDTINWLAISRDARDISEVTRSLGMLMRFSLKKESKCPVEEELDAVENYIKIQKYRYGKKLRIKIHAQENSLYEVIPIHILLPLVENAVEHGLSEISEEKYIWIRSEVKKDRLRLSVCDNGIGINQAKKHEILKREKSDTRTEHMSIGMSNVQQRLTLYYGEKAEFIIKDREEGGTIILIYIPVEIRDFESDENEGE